MLVVWLLTAFFFDLTCFLVTGCVLALCIVVCLLFGRALHVHWLLIARFLVCLYFACWCRLFSLRELYLLSVCLLSAFMCRACCCLLVVCFYSLCVLFGAALPRTHQRDAFLAPLAAPVTQLGALPAALEMEGFASVTPSM